ncbi:MAG: FHA domain-containing protein [Dongiaceae bacterium]
MGQQEINLEAAVLLADIVGSTPLYESAGNVVAVGQISHWRECVCQLVRDNDGEYISSKGDDVLSIFSDPANAFRTAAQMRQQARLPISFHAGLHYGPIIRIANDIYGDAVNLTARLASIANPGEILMSENFVELLQAADKEQLSFLDKMTFKGKSQPCSIYTFFDEDRMLNTQISFGRRNRDSGPAESSSEVRITLRYNDQTVSCRDKESVSIGRSPDCDLVIDRRWVSRFHATVSIANGRVRLAERSTSGTFISTRPGQEVLVRREDILLMGSGTISPGMRCASDDAQIIQFEITMR